MRIKRIWIMFKARNWEFFRDRASFGWNFLFPFLLVAGFGILFGGKEPAAYKIGVFPEQSNGVVVASLDLPDAFKKTRFLQFVGFATQNEAMEKLRHHKIDMVIRTGRRPTLTGSTTPPPTVTWLKKSFRPASPAQSIPHSSREARSTVPKYAISTGCFPVFWP